MSSSFASVVADVVPDDGVVLVPVAVLVASSATVFDSPENSFEDQLNLEFQCQLRAGDTDDFREGVGAFLEKRPAQFKGK